MFVSVDTTCPDVAKTEHEAAQNVHERVDAQKCKDAAMFAMLPDEQVIERATSTECKMRKGMPAACNSGSVCEQLSRLSTDQVLGSYAAIRTSPQVWVRSGCNATLLHLTILRYTLQAESIRSRGTWELGPAKSRTSCLTS